MAWFRQYILSVICVAIVCGLVQVFFTGKSSTHSAAKLIVGLVLTVTVIRPLLNLDEIRWDTILSTITADGTWAVAEGKEQAVISVSERIKEETETYILNKAIEMGVDITVDVKLGEEIPPMPTEITIKGPVSPYAKLRLTECLKRELGITEEHQIWIS